MTRGPDPVTTPVVNDPVGAVLGEAGKAAGPDSFRAIPETVKAILDVPTPDPDVTGLNAGQAAAARAQWVTREKLRAAGVGLDSLAPVGDASQPITPGVLSNDARTDGSAQAASSSLADLWRSTVEKTAYVRELQEAEPTELAAIRATASLADALDDWRRLRTGSFTPDSLAAGADAIRRAVAALDKEFVDEKTQAVRQPWMDLPSTILKGIARELARQVAENLQGRSHTLPPTVNGVAFTLRQATSRYQGAFTAATDVQQAATAVANGPYAAMPWASDIGTGAKSVADAIKDIADAHKDPVPPGTPPLGTAISNLVAAADTFSRALMAARGYIEHQSQAGAPPIELEQIASFGVYLSSACQSIAASDPLAQGKFGPTLSRIRQGVAPQTPVAGDLTDYWSQAQRQLTAAVKTTDQDRYDRLTANLGKLALDKALTDWSTQAKAMPKTADKLYSASWRVATLIGQGRAAITDGATPTPARAALTALDDIALTISTEMIKYGALFPSYF